MKAAPTLTYFSVLSHPFILGKLRTAKFLSFSKDVNLLIDQPKNRERL